MATIMVALYIPVKHAEHGYSKAWGAIAESAQIAANAMQTNGQNH